MLATLQVMTLLLVALAMAPAVAHALELPGKKRLMHELQGALPNRRRAHVLNARVELTAAAALLEPAVQARLLSLPRREPGGKSSSLDDGLLQLVE
jgi:hypothetical protein